MTENSGHFRRTQPTTGNRQRGNLLLDMLALYNKDYTLNCFIPHRYKFDYPPERFTNSISHRLVDWRPRCMYAHVSARNGMINLGSHTSPLQWSKMTATNSVSVENLSVKLQSPQAFFAKEISFNLLPITKMINRE